jgi:osmotically-inducible protein OsmY
MARLQAWAQVCALSLPLALGGCVEMLVVGGIAAAAGGGYAAGQERGVDGIASDFAIKTDIAKVFIETDPQLQAGITTTVYNGRVLLTGRVAEPAMKATAVQLAAAVPDVQMVHDEIEVAPPGSIWDSARDTWLTTQIRSEMVVDTRIRSVNYSIETANGSVYLIGSARTQGELERATTIARHVPGVKRVVSYVDVRPGAPVTADPVAVGRPAPPPTAGLAPVSPSAAPRTPIEVQKL